MARSWLFISLFSFFNSLAIGAVSPATITACKALEKALPNNVLYKVGATAQRYNIEQGDYWSVALSSLSPACIVQPTDAQQVSQAVKILNQNEDAKFAIKSGGHDPNPGQSAMDEGIVIALSHLNGTTYDPAKKVAYVKPGGHWWDVIGALDKQSVTVVGGRLGIVGVGGYLAQGGLSFLSAQYGMAADQIEEYEVVKADGSIVTVNMQSDKDLMIAMRGGGHMYGIITKFTLRTYPIGKVWGGYRIYTSGKGDAVHAAFHKFLGNAADPKAALIVNTSFATQGSIIHVVFFFYDGPKPPAGVFAGIEDIKPTFDFCSERTYNDLMIFNARGTDLLGFRASFRTITLPHVESDPGWYQEILGQYGNITLSYLKSHFVALTTVAMQAFPASIGKNSEARGGNAMGLTANDKTRFILEINTVWRDPKEDAEVYGMAKQLTDILDKKVANVRASSASKAETYLPYFMNDAAYDQDVFGSYKDAAKFKTLQEKADPNGFWRKQSQGFPMS